MKINFRRITCLALVLVTILSLVACSNNESNSKDKQPNKAELIQNTSAVQIGDITLSAVELNYFYIDEVETYARNYSSYLSYLLDINKPIGKQYYDAEKKVTWADYFLDMTITSIQDTYALYNAAKAANFKLSAEDQKYIDDLKVNLKAYADYYGFGSVNIYLASIYGKGASEKTYLAYCEIVKTADAYYRAYEKELGSSYTPAQLRDFEKDKPYNYNSYSYVSFLLSLDKFKTGGTKNEDGSYSYTDAQMAQFREELKAAAEKLSAAENNTLEKLNEAIKALEIELDANKFDNSNASIASPTAPTTGSDNLEEYEYYSTATQNRDVLYTRITPTIQEWIRSDARKEGDITMIANTIKEFQDGKEVETINGYYIVIYNGMNKNEYALANVRHVLISFKSDTNPNATTFTDAEKKAAKDKAEKLLAEWEMAGDLSEESFAELAKKNSDDGSAEEGGLFEDVYPGQMTTGFNDWCFDENRKAGDTGIVETEYGYHIMFYVGDSNITYRDYMVSKDKVTADLAAWKAAQIEKTVVEILTSEYIDRDLILDAPPVSDNNGEVGYITVTPSVAFGETPFYTVS